MKRRDTILEVASSGVRDGLSNQALDRRMLACRAALDAEATLRFYRTTPTVSVGRHQALAREVRLDYCRRNRIDIVRRVTGGGALYLDPNQVIFSLAARNNPRWCNASLVCLLQDFAVVVAQALNALGVAACAASPNDVEVEGRKIASVYAARSADTLFVHGIVLLDADVRTMLEALRVPTEKLTADGLATARDRLATLAELRSMAPSAEDVRKALATSIARVLDARVEHRVVDTLAEDVTAAEREAEREFAALIGWEAEDGHTIESAMKTPAGATLRARAEFVDDRNDLRRVEFATDAHLEPEGFLRGLQDALRGTSIVRLTEVAQQFADRSALRGAGLAADDVVELLQQLVAKNNLRARHRFSTHQVNALMLHAAGEPLDAEALLQKATVMLVPYCAKPAWCKWRHREGCSECGLCEVGDAYRLARERRMQVKTIVNYEHLVTTLRRMQACAVPAYVGMCCGNFFLKRSHAFADAHIPAVLMDISGANCYELKQEDSAYAGTFSAQARIDRELLARVIELVPAPEGHAASTGV